MPKTGRNEPCPCGSGKKYKHCCLPKDEAAEWVAFAEKKKAAAEAKRAAAEERSAQTLSLRQIREQIGARIDEAARAARNLLVRYPQVHDGYDRLGMVYEARGQNKAAADCYRKVIEFAAAHPDQYEPQFATTFHDLVAKLDPPAAD
jgi:tetratricopeptide (TPR) repeat protein